MASGTPEQVRDHAESLTGAALRGELEGSGERRADRVAEETGDTGDTGAVHELDHIVVRNARTHNLHDVDVEIPRDALTVITGPSGSGKSSLALDTIYTEGRRRFVESLSTYARQFLGTKDRPPVDRIDGLGPSVAVEAGTSRGHPRSTVATTTEIHDHLRVLFARAGVQRCPEHGVKLERTDPGLAARRVVKDLAGEKGWIVAPIFGPGLERPEKPAEALKESAALWRREGFLRMLHDGVELRLDEPLPRLKKASRVDLVIDRLGFGKDSRGRIADAIEQASGMTGGRVSVIVKTSAGAGQRVEFSIRGTCPECGFRLAHDLAPRHFSFNTHAGACEACDGLGLLSHCDADKLISDPEKALTDGAIGARFGRYLTKGKGYYEHLLRRVARSHRIDLEKPYRDLTPAQQALLMTGEGSRATYDVLIEKGGGTFELEERFEAAWPGLCGHVDAWHAKAEDPEWATLLESVMSTRPCRTCKGERLRPEVRAVTVGRKRLPEVASLSVGAATRWLSALRLPAGTAQAVAPVIDELRSRVELLERVGLGYLTLDRATQTLSGGEARRVRLSASIGSRLVGVCYVLDEPTVGLHPADVERLTDALLSLRDTGNTVLVVEHDESLMRRADYIVDMGPGAGRLGGRVVAAGTPDEVRAVGESSTGAALRGDLRLRGHVDEDGEASDGEVRRVRGERVSVAGARLHNLKNVDFELEFGRLTGVCGPSGSGKSTLVLETLVPGLRGEASDGRWRRVRGRPGGGGRVVVINAEPIGRTPASIPATYTGLMDPLRALFERTAEARMRGFTASHFSFNSPKGRCPACDGRGSIKVEMQFLADLWLECEECDGQRFAPEILEVTYRGRNIAEVLSLSVEEALEFLSAQPDAARILTTLRDVGLGYMSLGQSSTTLSGGEAQRVKLASELFGTQGAAPSVLVLDEPSTGLHACDVQHLARVLVRLADEGHAVCLIEHHTGLLTICDNLVELGPGGGEAGGRVVARGTPAELAADPESPSGPFIARELAPPAEVAGAADVVEASRGGGKRPAGRKPRRRKAAGSGGKVQ